MLDLAARLLKRHEGFRARPYQDTVGKLTVGYGRNLDDVGITEAEATHLLWNDLEAAAAALASKLPWWDTLDAVRQTVLICMAVNMGVRGLLTFQRTLTLIADRHFEEAAVEMLRSKWATQVGERARELARMMHTGEEPA